MGQNSCARNLFITKPKQKIEQVTKEQVKDVIGKLNEYLLEGENKGNKEGGEGENDASASSLSEGDRGQVSARVTPDTQDNK